MAEAGETETTEPAFEVPSLACDCHMHIFGPLNAYPYDSGRIYTPPEASIDAYIAMRQRLGLERVVVVQPSVYGVDNRCQLDAISRISGARGVAVISGDEPDAELERLHQAGFRGARINLEQGTIGGSLESVLNHLGARLREMNWHLQIFAKAAVLESVEPILSRFPVPVMFDHFANLSPWQGPAQPGFDTVRGLLRDGDCWMKLSAAYHHPRREEEGGSAEARRFVSALIEAAPDQLVWGSNWPHPNVFPKTTASEAPVAPFRQVDDLEMMGLMVDWARDEATLQRILVDNPARFYDF